MYSPIPIKAQTRSNIAVFPPQGKKKKQSALTGEETRSFQIHYDRLEQLQLYECTLDSPFFQSSLSKS